MAGSGLGYINGPQSVFLESGSYEMGVADITQLARFDFTVAADGTVTVPNDVSAVGALVAPGVGSLTFETTVSHGGSVAGYTASMAVDPETRIGVVLLRNYQSGATNLGRAAQGLVARLSALTR